MKVNRRPSSGIRRAFQTASAFLRIGYLTSISYPLGFVIEQLQGVVFPIIFYFVTQLMGDRAQADRFGGDYYTYTVIGLFALQVISAGIRGFAAELDTALHRGNFEMLLVEPVRWRLLPFGMSLWPSVIGLMPRSLFWIARSMLCVRLLSNGWISNCRGSGTLMFASWLIGMGVPYASSSIRSSIAGLARPVRMV